MENNILRLLFNSLFISFLLISCESHEQSADAFELVKKQKMSNDTMQTTEPIEEIKKEPIATKKPVIIEIKKTPAPIILDDWSAFNLETGKKIKVNESQINAIKVNPNATTKWIKKAIAFEKANNNLSQQMEVYKQEEKLRFATFKSKINEEAIEISVGLKDLIISN